MALATPAADPTTVPGVLDTIRAKFGIDRVILVGDRAMITDALAAEGIVETRPQSRRKRWSLKRVVRQAVEV